MKKIGKKVLSIVTSITMMAQLFIIAAPTSVKAETTSIFTDYLPEITETIDANGFKHPGAGLTKEILENVREQVRAKKEPWNSYFNVIASNGNAGKTVSSNNKGGGTPPVPLSNTFDSQGFNGRFRADGLKAYTQALMYYITGDEVYRKNAMDIIRIWEQMDPTKYVYFTDAHIHTGIPLYRMVTAAEILRNTSCVSEDLKWTETDTVKFTTNLVNPVMETFNFYNGRFMNQHLYSTLARVSGAIFTSNKALYEEAVEWFTVNKDAVDQGQNGAIKALFRLVDTDVVTGEKVENPQVQLVEMGRDQAHSTGDVLNVELVGRLLLNQGTKVDPVEGIVSTAENAVGPFEFLENRILKGTDFFARYMLGYDTPWIPTPAHTDADGNPTSIYKILAENYRGRIGGDCYGLYYYYKYNAGLDMEKEAPYFTEMFNKRHYFYWDSPDAGGEYWLYIPKEAEIEGTQTLPKVSANASFLEVEDRYTKLDSNSNTMKEGDTSFVRINATESGSRIAIVGYSNSATLGLRIRTNGVAKIEDFGKTITLPDTKGEWRYVTRTEGIGNLAYLKVKGTAGTTVDIDHINVNVGGTLTPPVFKNGNTDMNLYTYVDSDVTINYDFSVTDSNTEDVLTYQIDNKPEGAVIDASTGAFSWKPTIAGIYSFVVSASDGTTVAVRNVKIVVANDRQSILQSITIGYDANTTYESLTVDKYVKVYNDVMNIIGTASDEELYQKLPELSSAVGGLKLLNPLLKDGSLNFVNTLASSTFGDQAAGLIDDSADSFAGYYLTPDQTFYMDFGTSYKVSPKEFKLQVRQGFPERIGGTAIFGSNDNETWIRLTPELTDASEDMQTLAVEEQYKNQQFRFFKIQMIEPSSNMLEMAEVRIFGQRFETGNKLESVSIASDKAVNGRVITGNTVKVSFKATEEIKDVVVNILGKSAAVNTVDNINWTAEAALDGDIATGKLRFTINYKTKDGIVAPEVFLTTDGSSLHYVNRTNFIDVPKLAKVTASDISYDGKLTKEQAGYVLFDGKIDTFGDLKTSAGVYYTVDFGTGSTVKLSQTWLMPRAGKSVRMNGLVIQGSNDNTNWTDITVAYAGAKDNTWSYISNDKFINQDSYRYIKIYNSASWNGNISEVELYGEVANPLKAALNQASVLDRTIYTSNSLQAVDDAVSAGSTILSNITATQAEAADAANDLQNALKALQYITGMPVLDSLTDQTIIAGNKLTFKVQAVNSDSGVVYKAANLPEGASFNADTQRFEWTPSKEQGGLYDVTFTASAGDLSSTKTIKIKVVGQPVIESSDTLELTAAQPFTFNVPASDPSGEPLVYKADNLPVGAAINSKTGTLNWTPTQADYGSHTVTFTVSNGNFSVEKTITFNVKLHILPAADYTKGSYYQYFGEMERIETAMSKPGADKVKLATEIAEAEKLLYRVPLSMYSFEDNANNSYGSAAGIVSGNPVYSAGKVGKAIDMNGSDNFVKLPSTNLISTCDEVTIATWVYWRGGSNWQRIFDFGNNTNQYLFLSPSSGNSTLRFAIKNGGSEQIVQTTKLATNQWVHIAVTLGSGTAKLYVNGELKVTNTGFTIKPSDFKPTVNYIGKSQWPDPLFNGMVDEFSIFNHVLSDEEIKAVAGNTMKWIDKSLLTLLLEKSAAINPDKCTMDSYAALQKVVSAAASVAGNADETQADIDLASSSLDTALNALVYDTTPPADATLSADITAWTNSDVTVTISYPADAAVKEYKVDDNGIWTAYTMPVVVSDNTTVYARGMDAAGNVSNITSYIVNNIDKTAPETKADITVAQPDGTNGWYVHPVTVTLNANDNLSGVSNTEYSLDGGKTWLDYKAAVTLDQDEKYEFVYHSKDRAGNVESTKIINLNVDTTSPEIAVTGFGNGVLSDAGDIVPEITLNDNMSGVDSSKLQVTLDGKPYEVGSAIKLYTLPLGIHTFTVNGSDLAGNTSSNIVTFKTFASVEGLKQLVTRFAADNFIDNEGATNSLLQKLENNSIQAFIKEVQAQSGKHINKEAADYLLRDANSLHQLKKL